MIVRNQVINDRYAIYHGDCIKVMQSLPDDSVHMSLYSPPFGSLMYQYSSDPADLSNCKSYEEFFAHYGFVVDELRRVTMPGRMSVVHCQDLFVGGAGAHHTLDFPGDIIRCHTERGWKYCGRRVIWKEPLTVRNRTMVSSLHHKTLVEDSTLCSLAHADFLLAFRRSGENPVPVAHPRGLLSYAGEKPVPTDLLRWRNHNGNQINNQYSQWIWRQYASSVWDDIRIDRTLGKGAGVYSANKADKDVPDEKHMHPLQLDVIERAVIMWSNPGETVLTPFMGVGSEVYGAIINNRRGIGIELKSAYYHQAVKNVAEALQYERKEQEALYAGEEEVPESDKFADQWAST